VAAKNKLLHDSLRLLTIASDSQYKVQLLYTELMVAACSFCYHLLTCTHGLACDHEITSLAANMVSFPHTGDHVVTCFVSLCLYYAIHEIKQCI